ncbi:MAG: ATP synthase F0 subunit B [Muribaculaceae bacterium]|nr:ATP synthase F0 subunit B [Muribaculaceae bacterium]
MNAIFYNPILNIIRKRENYINSNYEDSKRFDSSAKEYADTRSAKIEQTQKECRHDIRMIISKAHSEANAKISEAREATKEIVRKKKETLAADTSALKTTVKDTVVKDLASVIATRLLGRETTIDRVDYDAIDKVMD